MAIYDMPRAEVVSNLDASVGAYLAARILAAIDAGGGQSDEVSIVSDFAPGDPIPATTDILIVRPGEGGALSIPAGVGAVIFTGPTGVQVSLTAEASVAMRLTDGADVLRVSALTTGDPAQAVSVDLGAGDDVFIGAQNVRNNVIGGAGDDDLSGGDRNDSFDIGQGNDNVDAGAGYDQAYIRGSIKDYASALGADGTLTLTNTLSGEVTLLKNLEFITFSDGGVMLNVTSETGFAAAALYEVVLGRSADAGGHEFYSNSDGPTLIAAADGMLGSDEFAARFGPISSLTDSAFMDIMYSTAFERSPDASGLTYWLDQLANGMSRGEVAVRFAYSSEAQAKFDAMIHLIDNDDSG